MIPGFNHSHVLPPFVGERMTSAHSSPYPVTASALAQRFAFNDVRCVVLDGLFRYRAELRSLGFTKGLQWLDGSFVEAEHDLCKREFYCDTSLVNLTTSPEWLVTQTRYWYGLYSHRRGDALWKGMLQLPLDSDDVLARALLQPLAADGNIHAGST
jgi:hypothetical protein